VSKQDPPHSPDWSRPGSGSVPPPSVRDDDAGGHDLAPRLRAVCDLRAAGAREYGRHEYDGMIQDLSCAGVQAGLARVAAATTAGNRLGDPHDEMHLAAFEDAVRVRLGNLQMHRRDPLLHLEALDLVGYDKDYAPEDHRAPARAAHLRAWPDAIDTAVSTLDQLSAPVAAALASGIRGLAAGVPAGADGVLRTRAAVAHARLVEHIDAAARGGPPDAALGSSALSALLGSGESMSVDLGRLAERADAERLRLNERLAESCGHLDRSRPPFHVVRDLMRDHPADAAGIVEAARAWTQRAIDFTRARSLVPDDEGECRVGLSPESQRMAMAMMSPVAPGEPDGPSWYYITPPDPSWTDRHAEEWLRVFSSTTLPAITVHEVAPGHFSHSRARRQVVSQVRRTLHSSAFIEGWAHYAEELCVEEGFCEDDPRFEIGVWLQALVRVTRLACAIGVHSGGMSVSEAARRFESHTHLTGAAALSEGRRAAFDPTYGRYTWGKLEIMDLRGVARTRWGAGFSLGRFHAAMMDLGSPPLGLLGTAIERG
jgi:hypothetical protein